MLTTKISSTNDEPTSARLEEKIYNKTRMVGGLGLLEMLARQLGMIQKTTQPRIIDPSIMVFAGDHGIAGKTKPFHPERPTWQVVDNFLAQEAATSVFALQNDCRLQVIDAGVDYDFGLREGLIDRKISFGTRGFDRKPAMSCRNCRMAISYGMALVSTLDSNVIGFGGIGAGSALSAAALMHKLTHVPVAECIDVVEAHDIAARSRKIVEEAALHHASVSEPLAVLAAFGGFETAMMVGAMLRAAELRRVLVIDGFVVANALLVASRLEPHILDYCVFADRSKENAYRLLLDFLEASPLLSLGTRKGEGSGAALAMPLLHAAVALMDETRPDEVATVRQKNGFTDDLMISSPRISQKKVSF